MNISLIGKKCTGCLVCVKICRFAAIKIVNSDEGFLYPLVDDGACSGCGKCIKYCPECSVSVVKYPIQQYAARVVDGNSTIMSTSGGAFFILAKYIIEKHGGYVCGAAFDYNNFEVKHIIIDDIKQISKLQGSKYVQSNIYYCFDKILNLLKNNRYVLFTGTPCQVAAVKNYCRGFLDYLYTVDIICHGVPSPENFKNNISRYVNNKKIRNIRFRHRTRHEASSYSYYIEYEDNSSIIVYPERDVYYSAFLLGYSVRESCYSCKYARRDRVGDITLGDCNDRRQYVSIEKGFVLSDILLNTEKGLKMWECVRDKMYYVKLDYEKESIMNRQLSTPTERPSLRDEYYIDCKVMTYPLLLKKYGLSIKGVYKIKNIIKRHTSNKARKCIEQIWLFLKNAI